MSQNIGLNATVLCRLTYVSRAKPELNSSDLKEILKQAQYNNQQNGITGMLCFNKCFFLQTIEGARPELSSLLNKISADNRHFDLQIIESVEIHSRHWSEWSMNYATPTKENSHIYLKYSTSEYFNPFLLSAEAAQDLLTELSIAQIAKTRG